MHATHATQCTQHAKHTQTNAMQTYRFFLGCCATHVAGERAHVADEGLQQVAGQVGHTPHGKHHHHVLERHRHPQVLIVVQVQAAIHRKATLSRLPTASAFYHLLDKLVATWLVPREPAAISVHVLCAPYNHAPVFRVISLEAILVWCMRLAVTCHLHPRQNDQDLLCATVVTQGWNGYRNNSQHRKLTLKKKILLLLLTGLKPS